MFKFLFFRRQRAVIGTMLLLALSFLAGGARAQDYRLGARDVLSVTVLRHPELSAERIEVDPGGRIRLPFVGSIVAAGKTTGEITAIVRRGLLTQLNDPTVTVTVLQTRPQQVAVSGAVKNPGLFEIGQNWRISEAIAAAGGLATPVETATATFSRAGSPATSLNLANVLRNSGSSENRLLRAGDSLRILENTVPVRVAGTVAVPGALQVPRGATISDAIALAGGFATGASRAVTVTRKNGASGVVNLGPDNTNKTLVQAGDLIVVSQSNDRVAILGAVSKPGYIALDVANPLQLAQALAETGGLSARAAGSRAILTRANGETLPLDLYALTVLGDKSQNVRLRPGDVITVPEARGVTVFGAVTKPGTYTLEESRAPRVADAIIAAGNLSVPAAQAFIRIERAPQNATIINAPASNNSPTINRVPGGVAASPPIVPRSNAATPPITLRSNADVTPRTFNDLLRENAQRNGTALPNGLPPIGGANASGANAPGSNAFNPNTLGANDLLSPNAAPSRSGANATDANILNARVYDGDRVTVEAITALRVTVKGEVKTPGAFEVAPGTNLVDIIARAGSETSQASLENVTIKHADGSSETVNVRAAALLGTAAPPILLSDGDYVVVPRSQNLIYVVGGVKTSDYYAVPPSGSLTLGESLSLAGGPIAGAQLNKIEILRSTPDGTQTTKVSLKQNKGQVLAADIPIRAGDVVFVPEANNKPSTLTSVFAALSILNPFRR